MTTIAIIGAGGKMGVRTAKNLAATDYDVLHVEPYPAGQQRLAEIGISTVDLTKAAAEADIVILTVPDNRIGTVAHTAVPLMKSGAMVIMLDAAAPYAGHLPERDDIRYIACHPCHPPVFCDETIPEAQQDYFGGVAAKQDVVIAVVAGTDDDYALAEPVVRAMFAPVRSTHRVTLDDMILLEPVLSETVAATCVSVIREATDEVIARGVPAEAAFAFVLGHLRIELAVLFDKVGSPFSDGALKAIESAKKVMIQPDWKRVFDPEAVNASVAEIVAP